MTSPDNTADNTPDPTPTGRRLPPAPWILLDRTTAVQTARCSTGSSSGSPAPATGRRRGLRGGLLP